MAGSLNKVTILGNCARDPEIKSLQNGTQLANLSGATSETWKDKASGEKKERSEFHRVVVFNPGLVGVIERYVKKGTKVYIEGSLQTRKWTDQAGNDRYSTEIVLAAFNGTLILCGAPPGGGSRAEPAERPAPVAARSAGPSWDQPGPLDDEIPF